jgi:hypothetical protein
MGRQVVVTGRTDRRTYSEIQRGVEVRRTPTKEERRVIWDRLAKKYLRSKGYLGPKIPSTWNWAYEGKTGQVTGHCKSDARKEIKKALGIKGARLPIDVVIERVTL